jgi:hypothetical protein
MRLGKLYDPQNSGSELIVLSSNNLHTDGRYRLSTLSARGLEICVHSDFRGWGSLLAQRGQGHQPLCLSLYKLSVLKLLRRST